MIHGSPPGTIGAWDTTYPIPISKDGLASFAHSLYTAAPGHVLTVYPGPTRTEHAVRYSPDNYNEERRMRPSLLADYIYKALRAGRSQLAPGMTNRVAALVGKVAPAVTETAMQRPLFPRLARPTSPTQQPRLD